MSRIKTATCRDCSWTGPVEETDEFRNVWDRVLPGQVMPAGQCPEEGCGGAAMLDRERERTVDLRPEMEALMLDLDRLHRSIYSGRLRAPIGAYIKELADFRPQGAGGRSAHATRLHHLRRDRHPHRRMGSLGHALAALGSCTSSARPPPSAPTATSSAPTP